MTLLIQARFENGVFVPETKVDFSEHQRVTLSIDTNVSIDPDDPNDPRPAGGVELVDWRARHRLQLDPKIADNIARSKAYEYYEETDDHNDPRPAGGVELVDWQARHRIQFPPKVAAEIMSNPEYNIENS